MNVTRQVYEKSIIWDDFSPVVCVMREKGFEIEKLSENTKAKQNQDENFRQDKTKISCFQRSQAVLSKMFSCKEYL